MLGANGHCNVYYVFSTLQATASYVRGSDYNK